MNAIEQSIKPYGSTTAGRLRIAIVVAVLVVGLVGGFGLGRVGYRGGSTVVPDRWVVPASAGDYFGPGHVPRHWIDQSSLSNG
jgi:hypothetical protein